MNEVTDGRGKVSMQKRRNHRHINLLEEHSHRSNAAIESLKVVVRGTVDFDLDPVFRISCTFGRVLISLRLRRIDGARVDQVDWMECPV